MTRFRRILSISALSVGCLISAASLGAAQTGFVHLATHLAGTPVLPAGQPGSGFTAIYLKNPDGSATQIYSLEFAPGSYTLARVEGFYHNCTTEALDVAFTITANQWTDVDVPMTFQDCEIELSAYGTSGGTGTEQITIPLAPSGSLVVADCQLQQRITGEIVYENHTKCHHTLPYHSAFDLWEVRIGGALTAYGDSIHITPLVADTLTDVIGGSFVDNLPDAPPPPLQHPDLVLVRNGGTYGGEMLTASYTLTNSSADRARQISVEVAPFDSSFGGYAMPMMTTSRGWCTVGHIATCYIPQMDAGESVDLTLTYAATKATNGNQTPYCTSIVAIQPPLNGYGVETQEIDTTNNRAACKPGNIQVTVSAGGNAPGNTTVAKGTSAVPMLQFTLNPATSQTLNSITVQGQGSGNDQVDVTAITLYLDVNGDGLVDAGDSALASGTYGANNGTAVLTLSPGYAVTGTTSFLVTYDFSVNLAERLGGGAALALLPFLFVPMFSRRTRGLAMLGMILLVGISVTSCGGSDATTPSGNTVTYQVKLSGVNLSGTDVPGVAINGATVTIVR